MTNPTSAFIVFDSKPALAHEQGVWLHPASKGVIVSWPKVARRGRPRKDAADHRSARRRWSNDMDRSLKARYEFVECFNGRQPRDSTTRKIIRTHVMCDSLREKQITANLKPNIQDAKTESQYDDTRHLAQLENILVLSPGHCSQDPFDAFPIPMAPRMHELLYLYVSAVAEHLYNIEAHWGFNPTKRFWIPLALTDSALMTAIMFSSDQFQARVNGRRESPMAVYHLQHTVEVLNERLQDPFRGITDTTIAAVAGLALTEQLSGNHRNWRIHMMGIKRMVELRGGLAAFECNPILRDKLCRADICGSIYAISKPVLQISSDMAQTNMLKDQKELSHRLPTGFQAIQNDYGFDSSLIGGLHKVHTVTRILNIANTSKSEAVPLRLREILRSVQYCLLSRLECDENGESEDQVLRICYLGILLYASIIQNDFWISPISALFKRQLRARLLSDVSGTGVACALRLWILFLTGSVAFGPTERSWLFSSIVQASSQLSLTNWSDAKSLLESFAWVGKIQDKSGRALWDDAWMRIPSRILISTPADESNV